MYTSGCGILIYHGFLTTKSTYDKLFTVTSPDYKEVGQRLMVKRDEEKLQLLCWNEKIPIFRAFGTSLEIEIRPLSTFSIFFTLKMFIEK